MKPLLRFLLSQALGCIFVFKVSVFSQTPVPHQEPGFADVATFVSSSYNAPIQSPPKALVNTLSKSICYVQILQNNGLSYHQSGVLINGNLVITAMHGFLEKNYTPVINPNSVKVYFGYFSGNLPPTTDAGWCNVTALDPTPDDKLRVSSDPNNYPDEMHDFIVLKLDRVPSSAIPAHVTLPFDKTYFQIDLTKQRITTQPAWPLFLAHPEGYPMYLSYDPTTSFSMGINNIDFSTTNQNYIGWGGSSGGGLFWSNASVTDSRCGDLLGIVSGIPSWADGVDYKPSDPLKPYIINGPTIGCVFDKNFGAKILLPAGGYQLCDNITSDDLNTVWEAYITAPASAL